MNMHPSISEVVAGFEAAQLHAAHAGREVMRALVRQAGDSDAPDLPALAAEFETAVDALLAVMPAYAPPLNVMHRLLGVIEEALERQASVSELKRSLLEQGEQYQAWSQAARMGIVRHGAAIIKDGATLFTFTRSETVTLTLIGAKQSGKVFRVLVTESRPNNDGLETVRRLEEVGIPVAVAPDACLGELIPSAELVLIGAEAIQSDGSALCKVGTYPVALVAERHGVPLYVVVDTMKLNASSALGLAVWQAPFRSQDVFVSGSYGRARVLGSLFDRTPAHLITGIVTERGILNPASAQALLSLIPLSRTLSAKLMAQKSIWQGRSPPA